jgi:hypothetical protein
MEKPIKRAMKYERQERIMKRAAKLRRKFAADEKSIDIRQLLEGGIKEYAPRFDWIVGDDSKFKGLEDAEAYVDFSGSPLMVLREGTYADLYEAKGTRLLQVRFIIAHEFGHFFLHQRSRKTLPRRKVKSSEQYKHNRVLELEANVFAGSFLVPTTGMALGMDANTIALRYQTSQSVAEQCVKECQDYRRIALLREKLK